jgi:hypothetical protein
MDALSSALILEVSSVVDSEFSMIASAVESHHNNPQHPGNVRADGKMSARRAGGDTFISVPTLSP